MKLRTIKSTNVKDKRVLVRVDFNVPVKNKKVIDDTRIKAALPTIEYLLRNKAKLILISHLGRPKGRRQVVYSLRPIARHLYKILNTKYKRQVRFVPDCIGPDVEKVIDQMKPGRAVLLENLRFYPEEEKNNLIFAKKLAGLADIYVNNAFAVSHRKHASIVGVTKFLPGYAGLLLGKEVKILSEVLRKPRHPLVVILGGVKISTKLGVINNLAKLADKILIGGALANNFLKVRGDEIGQSIYEKDMIGETKKLLESRSPIVLPVDVREDKYFAILDIGPKTVKLFSDYIKKAKMLVWNGPLGAFERKGFDKGTRGIARAILANKKAKIIIGGGETIAALNALKPKTYPKPRRVWGTMHPTWCMVNPNIFISTGGGAMLKFLSGDKLPGIEALI